MSLTEKVLNAVLEEALSPQPDPKAGKIRSVPTDELLRKCAALDTVCPSCSTAMNPEHAHYRCPKCHYRDSCCF